MLVTNCVPMRPLNRLRVFGAHKESRGAHLVWQVLIYPQRAVRLS